MFRIIATALAASLTVTACSSEGGGIVEQVFGEDEGLILDLQKQHASGLVVRLTSLRVRDEQTIVTAEFVNGSDDDKSLAQFGDRTYLELANGERLELVPPPDNESLRIDGGQRANAELVFAGAIPDGESVTIVFNNGEEGTSRVDSSPGFRFAIPLRRAAFIGGADKTESSLSNNVQVMRSSLRRSNAADSSGSSSSMVGSSVSRVEALESELGATQTERGTLVSLPGDVLFDYDEASIRSDARATLDTLAELIEARNPPSVAIEGHTDSRGSDAYNDDLAERRAESVRDYLTQRGGNVRMQVRSFGEGRPVAPNQTDSGEDNPDGRQRNRRVEVILENR